MLRNKCHTNTVIISNIIILAAKYRIIVHNYRDKTKRGHCLGNAEDRPSYMIPERSLSPLSVMLQQVLIHLSMLLGCSYGGEQVTLWLFSLLFY